MKSTLQRTCLLLCALALFFVHTPPSLAAEGGSGWSFSDDGTLTLNRRSGIIDLPFGDWEQVKTLRLGPTVETFLMCDDIEYFYPEKIWVNSKNPHFKVENGLLIDLRDNKVVTGEIGIVDAVIPGYITQIGMRAFARHTTLQTVTFPDGLLDIDWDAFEGCTSLKEIHLPEGLQWMELAFTECTGLTSVTIPAGAKTECAFRSCTSLTQATFADGAVEVGVLMFWDCTALTDVYLPDSIRVIGYGAFSGCTSLETLPLPAYLETVEERAFKGCSNLKVLDFPAHVKIAPDALPYELPTPTPIPTPSSAPTPAPSPTPTPALRSETPTSDTVAEQGSFGRDQLLLIGIVVLVVVDVVAIVVYKRKRR